MSNPATPPAASPAQQLLDRSFLDLRCRLLDLASGLDRIDRAAGAESARSDPRRAQIEQALRLLLAPGTSRAEQIQLLFSDSYTENWLDALRQGQAQVQLAGQAFREQA
ncbi:MAG: hypothetical protein ACKO3P_17865 [Planctomycetaceae bacterium]